MLGVMQKWATFSNHAYDRNADKATASWLNYQFLSLTKFILSMWIKHIISKSKGKEIRLLFPANLITLILSKCA
jgi:hypothetical protein